RVLRAELGREIQRRLAELPADQRLAIILSDIEGYNHEEIVAVTGWRPGTLKSRLSRGRARLRDALRAGYA
ncbi:MAG TPA: sigma factor-like helix-turn-helix DNA-binding protein, partial [Herpetosiphonaceae bacterium]|nr:sigma factor-like helix-turn-helix DNA-binding protein [Herpetosiphonaceae bacterium]